MVEWRCWFPWVPHRFLSVWVRRSGVPGNCAVWKRRIPVFQPGELLIYGCTGVCRVLSVDLRQEYADGVKQSRLYYQLKPLRQGGVIYTPVDNSKVVMRPVISREEAEALIRDIPTLQPAACPSVTTQALTQHYQTSLRRHSCRSLMELTMGIYQKRRRAEAQNRRLGMVDQRFMKQAEQLLYGELSAALDIPYEEVQPYIAVHAGAGAKC